MTNNTVYRYLGYGTTDSTGTAKVEQAITPAKIIDKRLESLSKILI